MGGDTNSFGYSWGKDHRNQDPIGYSWGNDHRNQSDVCVGGNVVNRKTAEMHQVDSNLSVCYDAGAKEDTEMSFAGFTFVNERIFAFSDSAGTKKNDLGIAIRDYAREPIKKLFVNERMAIITTGINEIVYKRNEKEIHVDISTAIDKYMASSMLPEIVASKLFNLIQKEKVTVGGKILLAGIYKRQFEAGVILMLVNAEISDNSFHCNVNPVFNHTRFSIGDMNYITYFNYHSDLLDADNTETISRNIENVVLEMDKRLPYNPVGGKIIVVEIFLTETV